VGALSRLEPGQRTVSGRRSRVDPPPGA
jgi:hypothetical protein